MPSSRISCVIFDIDGTLTDTHDLIVASFNHVTGKYLGRTYTPAEIVKFFGPPEEGALAVLFDRDTVPAAMDELCAYYSAHHASMAALHAGITEILDYLKGRGVRLAVFTGKGKRTTAITLDAFDLRRYFDLIVTGNDVVKHKPDPEGILRVLETFSLTPGEALMVGDSLGDLTASRGAGVRIATVLWDSYEPERVLNAGTDYVFHDAHELLSWFRSLFN